MAPLKEQNPKLAPDWHRIARRTAQECKRGLISVVPRHSEGFNETRLAHAEKIASAKEQR
jgi:hypothetical protein